jgi:DNA mismatch repair protein MutS2
MPKLTGSSRLAPISVARIPVPDLLHARPHLALDGEALADLLETSFLGGGGAETLDQVLAADLGGPDPSAPGWREEFFREDLFLDELIEETFRVTVRGRPLPVNRVYLRRVLSHAPTDCETVEFRQQILRELATDADLDERCHELYGDLFTLLSFFKASHKRAKLDVTLFRLEILEQAKKTIDAMAAGFGGARSGLQRLAETAVRIQETREYRTLAALLDYEDHLSRLTFALRIGADGRIRNLELREIEENVRNPFYRRPWRRLKDRIALLRRGYEFTSKELVNRVVHEVFITLSDWLQPLLQLLCHLAFYLSAIGFRERAERLGLTVSLAEFSDSEPLELRGLFNPLLMRQGAPVPCDLATASTHPILIVTGPNSGGKTRLLQAVGLAQLMGQAGLYVPAASARLPLVDGLFASATERASADQTEGRLGTELLRIRRLFTSIRGNSMVLMDELCSGTNPSEAEEIFLMVLELLDRLRPVALITTHFLDFARRIDADRPVPSLQFLQVEMDAAQHSTYQFGAGVADTSLAATTARRLGVTLEELTELIDHAPAAEPRRPTIAS